MITFEEAMDNALAVYVREWCDAHPEVFAGPEAVAA